jgi:hypothetical protein
VVTCSRSLNQCSGEEAGVRPEEARTLSLARSQAGQSLFWGTVRAHHGTRDVDTQSPWPGLLEEKLSG